MAFKPPKTGGGSGTFEPFVAVYPKEGNRYARVSLIVDMGIQEREDFEDQVTGESRPQDPCLQVAVFADLVNDVVDYGGKIGKKQYRMLLNKSFQQEVSGTNFKTSPPKDAKGKLLEGKPWCLHPANLLTKLARAVGKEEITVESDDPASLDIELLLGEAFLCNVEVKKTPAKGDKKDKDGNPIIYTNVNFKGAAPVPLGHDDEPMPVKPLEAKALCITFDGAKKEDIQFIRPGLLKQVKAALNYAGSQMQAAVEAFEAEKGQSNSSNDDAGDDQGGDTPAAAPAPAPAPAKKTAAAKKTTAKKTPPPAGDDMDDDVPF